MQICSAKFNIPSFKSEPIGYSYFTDEELKNKLKSQKQTKDSFVKQLNVGQDRKQAADDLLPLYIESASKIAERLSVDYPDVNMEDIIQSGLCRVYEYLSSKSTNFSLESIYNILLRTMTKQAIKEQEVIEKLDTLSKVDEEYKSNDIVDVVLIRDDVFKNQKKYKLSRRQKEYFDEVLTKGGTNSEIARSMKIPRSPARMIAIELVKKLSKHKKDLDVYMQAYESVDKDVENFVLPLKK